jgi:PP-loop superfamily ATP-utilizing enzyme
LDACVAGLKELGFNFVTLDLEGYRTGSLNYNLKNTPVSPKDGKNGK